jgi:esterase/lipase
MTNKIIDKGTFRLRFYPVTPSNKIIVIFTAMGTKIGIYRPMVRGLNKRAYSCLIYDYPLDILHKPKLQEWEQFYDDILGDARQRMHQLASGDDAVFYAYGVSMGTLLANKLTRDTPEIKHLILNLTYGDVARNIWTYRGVRRAKKGLMEQGIDEEALRRAVTYADPIVNASKLKGKKVLLYLSRNDRVLVYEQTKFTKQAFEAAELDFKYIEHKYLGHFLAGAVNLIDTKTIDDFYRS